MDLKPKSHISISSTESNKNTFNYYKNKGKTENRKNESINSNVEKELIKKLILISLKNKKFLERNDYFFSETKRQRNNKKIKLKLTPFQLYEKFKKFSMKRQLSNKYINSYPCSENHRSRNKINNLLTITNYRQFKKNPNFKRLCLTNTNTNSNSNFNNLYRNIKPKLKNIINNFNDKNSNYSVNKKRKTLKRANTQINICNKINQLKKENEKKRKIIMDYPIIKSKNHIMISELLKLKSSNLKIQLIKLIINILKKMNSIKKVKYFLIKG